MRMRNVVRVHLFELLGSSERKWGVAGVWKIYPVELQDRARLHFSLYLLSCGICAPEETEAAGSSTVDSKYLFLQQWRRWKTTDFFHFCNFSPNISAPCCVDIQRDKDHLQKHEVVCGCNCDI